MALALLAPWITPQNPYDLNSVDLMDSRLKPGEDTMAGFKAWLGTDGVGRDLYSGILYGLRISLMVGALAGLLALARRFPMLMAEQQARQWIPLMGSRLPRDLPGQTATLVGWGPIGQKLGSLLQALGLHVVAVRQHAASPCQATPDAVEHVTFERLHEVLLGIFWRQLGNFRKLSNLFLMNFIELLRAHF